MSTPPSPPTGVRGRPDTPDRSPRICCISTDVHASAALQATLAALLPQAHVDAADTSIVRSPPDADCVVLSVGRLYSAAASLVRDVRARGYEGAIVLVAESPASVAANDLAHLGVDAILAEATVAFKLPDALRVALDRQAELRDSPQGAVILASLRRLQAKLAAGEIVSGLPHRLNNPLAALLAEAQLLELESLPPEHMASVRRIVELCRRVIDVTRSIEGLGVEGAP